MSKLKIDLVGHHYDIIDVNEKYIYGLIDPIDHKIKYIGSSFAPRLRYFQHLKLADKDGYSNSELQKWIMYLVYSGQSPLLAIIEKVDRKICLNREAFWIKYYGFNNLFNLNFPTGRDGKLRKKRIRAYYLNDQDRIERRPKWLKETAKLSGSVA